MGRVVNGSLIRLMGQAGGVAAASARRSAPKKQEFDLTISIKPKTRSQYDYICFCRSHLAQWTYHHT
jgi:hypothetical protein